MNKNIKLFINYFLGPVIFIVLCWSLYNQLRNQSDLEQRWIEIKQGWLRPAFWLVFIGMFINWGIEALKWQLLVRPLERFGFMKAFRSVLAGCSITMLTPNRVGEYGGRILYVSEQNRLAAIPLTILGSISQLFVTVVLGTIGLMVFKFFITSNTALFQLVPDLAGQFLLYSSIFSSLVLALFYFRAGTAIKILLLIPYLKRLTKYLHFMYEFSQKQLLRILMLSILRYLVFILQYVLLLQIMQVYVPLADCFWLLSIFYLVMTMAPTIGFTELPLRAAASVQLLSVYSNNVVGMQAASLSIWIINLVIPAIAGSLLILGIKIMKGNETT